MLSLHLFSAQEKFDQLYVSSAEICNTLQITRPAFMQGRRRKQLPEPITIIGANISLWERPSITPFIEQWRKELATRRAPEVAHG